MTVTNRPELGEYMRRLRSHGITRDPDGMEGNAEGDWYYQQIDLGHNYRMTDMQAALGVSQMHRLQEFVERRRALADRYDRLLAGMPVTLPGHHPDAASAHHLYAIRVSGGAENRRRVFAGLRQVGIGVNVHYIPVHLHPYFCRLGFCAGDFPNAETYYSGAISLPMYFDLSNSVQDRVVDALSALLNG